MAQVNAAPCWRHCSRPQLPRIDLYERGSDPRSGSAAAGRSINLALAARGIRALETAGVMTHVKPLLVPMRGRMVHNVDGTTEFLRYGQRDDEQIFSVSRGRLNQVLLDAAEEHANIRIFTFNTKCSPWIPPPAWRGSATMPRGATWSWPAPH